MANAEHLTILQQEVVHWNQWRRDHPTVRPDLAGATLTDAELPQCNFSGADLRAVALSGAKLFKANFREADLSLANLAEAYLKEADFVSATLRSADFRGANLWGALLDLADLYKADLRGANLMWVTLVETRLVRADLTGSNVYGVSAWNVDLKEAVQKDLNISRYNEPVITVDDLEVAQFVYLILNNDKIRNAIDTIGQKGVLILGRFSEERKFVLDEIRAALRRLNFVPMMFDFQRSSQRDFTETIKTLAGLSRFIIADITNPKSSPLELQATMPDYMIPFVPIIQESEEPFAMFRDLKTKYGDWVLDVLKYDTASNLIKGLESAVVRPALAKGQELFRKKAEEIRTRHIQDFL